MPHIHELYDFVVTIYIVYEGKVLLVYHPKYSKWMPIGGHIELDEDPEEALFREIREECGLEVDMLSTKPQVDSPGFKWIQAPNFIDVHEANAPHRHISLTYFAKAKHNHHVKSVEHLEMSWLGHDDLEDPQYNLSEVVKFYCKEAIKCALRS